jgi:hypothetical protein
VQARAVPSFSALMEPMRPTLPHLYPQLPFHRLPQRRTISRSNYQVIFDSALEAYKKKTGKDLTSDPLLCNLETCHSPDLILQNRSLNVPTGS